jgi:predicted secreted protein
VEDLPAELTLHVGERRRFRLPGLAQAGYRWRASVESGADTVDVDTSFDEAGTAATVPGGPFAAEVLSIAARAPGRARVRLAQARSWETETAAIAERRLDITVVDRAP